MKRRTAPGNGHSLVGEYLRTRRRSRARNTVQGRKKSAFFVSILAGLARSGTGKAVAENVLMILEMFCCRRRRDAEVEKDRAAVW